MDQYRFEGIQDVRLNGEVRRLFKAFEMNDKGDAYIFKGRFSAPAGTPEADLVSFYPYGEEYYRDFDLT